MPAALAGFRAASKLTQKSLSSAEPRSLITASMRSSTERPMAADAPCASFASKTPLSTTWQRPSAAVRKRRRCCYRASAHPEEESFAAGNPAVQEELLRVLRAGVSRERSREVLREDFRQIVRDESDRLRRATDEAKRDVDRLQKLLQDRSKLEFGSALADINQSADAFEEELRRSRAEMEDRQAEFEAWEQRMARDRNKGQFFMGLYEAAKTSKKQGGPQKLKRSYTAADNLSEQALGKTRAIEDTSRQKVQSPLRVYVVFFLALNLSALCTADLLSGHPSYGLDGLYILLAASLGVAAWAERGLVLGDKQDS